MIRLESPWLWSGDKIIGSILPSQTEAGNALVALESLATELTKLDPTDASGIRLLQIMAREALSKLNQ